QPRPGDRGAGAFSCGETQVRTMRAMQWKLVHITASGPPTVLHLDGVGVVRLMERAGGNWFAVLDYHLPAERRRRRDCTSYEAGRDGAELWVQRHRARLAAEA